MSWKKHFKPVTIDGHGSHSPISGGGRPGPAKTNYSSFLPDVYAGTPNRIDRYMQYDTMDMDSEVNAALDIIAEFCTQKDKENETPFHTSFRGQPTSTEVKLIKDCLQKWCKQQQFETRIFRIVRNTFKYGDCFFLRDPETKKWLYVDPVKVSKIIANESEGKIPEQYVIKDINFNFKNLIAVTPHGITNTSPSGTASYTSGGSLARGMVGDTARATGTRFQNAINEIAVDAKDVVHISLSEGLDNNFPFGNSLLESVFKVYKQKELLEDAVIIYRVQRAPERRIFYVDVGNMPAHMAMGFVERVKNEIQQRRIPSSTGGMSSVDSSYNPLCLDLGTRIPLLDGRTLSLAELISEFESGKENWVYSCNPETGKVVPGVVNWAGVTRKDTDVIQLSFSNGKTLTCTPDHKIPVFGKGFVQAQQLTVDDILVSFNVDEGQIWDHELNSWVKIADMVGGFFKAIAKHQEFTYLPQGKGLVKDTINHKDYDLNNNDPRNLEYMNAQDREIFLSAREENFWDTGVNYLLGKSDDYIATLKSVWSALTPDKRNSQLWEMSELDVKFTDTSIKGGFDYLLDEPTKLSITGIEQIGKMDTGTITVDGYERWHDYHTFAIENGLFIKNSTSEDFFLPKTCVTLDTEVKLLDDRTLTVAELITEYEAGIENYAYTVNQSTKEIEPGKIVWAGVTRKNAELVEVLLDNGESIKCTPDHRFIMRDGSEVEAQRLQPDDSLMPLYLHDACTGKNQGADKYLRYTCPSDGKKKWVHIMVCPKQNPGKDYVIHHINCNSRDNNPSNLIEMEAEAHRVLHSTLASYHLQSAWSDPAKRQKLMDGIAKRFANCTPEERQGFVERGRINGAVTWTKPESAAIVLNALLASQAEVAEKRTVRYSTGMTNRMLHFYDDGINVRYELADALRNDALFQQEFKLANPNILRERNSPFELQVDGRRVTSMLRWLGYTDWNDFVGTYRKNHKVVSVTWLVERVDTGDITIESASDSHNFATAAGVFIHNSEGRGSTIDTLPGGQSLGEITDLRFFTNKLFRALRIPASYLPTGIEEASNTVADGKVGMAYIQEFRFNEYCKRLQNLLVQTFDLEFKLWLYSQGINIDSSLFELKFNEPQNFAAYRQSELDTTRVNIFAQLQEIPYLSKRFAMKRFLGMTQEEITENEAMWREENGHKLESLVDGAGELRSAGISPSGIASDMSAQDEMAPPEGAGGPEGATGGAGVAPGAAGGGAPGPTGGPMGV